MTGPSRTSVASRPALALIRGYQRYVSPLLGPRCRFYPSCSAYAVSTITDQGLVRGIYLAGRRLLRCHPWTDGGVDLPPDRVASGPVPPPHQGSSPRG